MAREINAELLDTKIEKAQKIYWIRGMHFARKSYWML